MKLTALLSRPQPETLPGTVGVARVDRRVDALLRKVGPGDVAVLDQTDLDRRTADTLVSAGVAAVVNAAPSISGRFPNLGPEIIVGAGIPLVDGVGPELLRQVKDGMKLRVCDGVIFRGEDELGRGTEQTTTSVADLMIEAKAGITAQLEAFSANTIEFLRQERSLLVDGVGVPDVATRIKGRQVLVVTAGYDHLADLRALRRHITRFRPVLVGVEGGADALTEAGYRPDLIVADPMLIGSKALHSGAELVVPAHPDGYAPGLERVQDLGISAVTFPAVSNPEDLALLLVDTHDAALVITVGFQATLSEFLDRGRSSSNPSTFLTRLRLGGKLVDGKAVAALHRGRVSGGIVALVVAAVLVAAIAALLVSGVGAEYLALVPEWWDRALAWAKELP